MPCCQLFIHVDQERMKGKRVISRDMSVVLKKNMSVLLVGWLIGCIFMTLYYHSVIATNSVGFKVTVYL